MGIRYLNNFLKDSCKDSIKNIHIGELSGKKIAIDISIYLYKFVGEGSLIENIYLMLSIFRYYNVIPVFIFDGKPPTEKKELLQKRRKNKLNAEKEYNLLKNKLLSIDNDDEKQDIVNNMDILKKQFIYITKKQIELVKNLIESFGGSYFDAYGEADELCALLVLNNKVWACLSEDMDLFVYGCPRVLRYLSLINHRTVIYDLKHILEELNMSQKDFREICILSGTDYNVVNSESPTLYKILKLFNKFKKTKENIDFYKWLNNHYNEYVESIDDFENINNMFDLSSNKDIYKLYESIKITNTSILKEKMKEILEKDGFIFP